MADTAQNLENEIEAHRAGVEQTLDKIKQRLSVDQMVDDVGQFLGVENVRHTLNAAGQQVRENPIALALIGAGVAWLMMGRGTSAPTAQDSWRGSADDWRGESDSGYGSRAGDRWQSYAGGQDRLQDGDTLTDKAKATAADLGATLGDVPGKVRDAMGKATESVQSTVDAAKEKAGSSVRPLTDTITAQPLLVGAVAVAIGAVLGSAMPRTRAEDRVLGPQRDKILSAASRATGEMGDRMADAARTTYQAATAAAHDEGLLPDAASPTLAQKVERVATAAFDTATAQVDPVLHGDDAASGDDTGKVGSDDGLTVGDTSTGTGSGKGKRPRA
ncbi:MAG: hypothetical protein Q7J44_15240 [Pseudotabrizicola sp.]|uniref:hypothetical protein n=1 Tax=Pseudotabrizicola sp. TaxID=2939647 RepID=UPI0027226A71|nr:hypothetical protein [Pseudotabrizicola sp.]MDO9639891.1 hypothetical protein [Pseudotabrizicola sp.]